MACFSPLKAWQLMSGEVVFAERGDVRRALLLPCQQCVGCRLERSRQWAVRCLHEAQCHDVNSFLTLTYENTPPGGSLQYRDFQLFMKRLRRSYGSPVRFFMCGEYGEINFRPHYHACLFGVHFPDRKVFSRRGDSVLYSSDVLNNLWGLGFASIGDVTFESAAYVARYVMKKVTGPRAAAHYERVNEETGEIYSLMPEFTRMSLKPGIGSQWLERFETDVYPRDYVVVRGKKCKPPRFYDKRFALKDPIGFEDLQYEREVKAQSVVDDTTPDRLQVREKVARAALNLKKRDTL